MKAYQLPKVYEIGTVKKLTEENPTIDKCGGSADLAYPDLLRPMFAGDCPNAP